MRKTSVFIVALLLPWPSLGGDSAHGGNVIVCPNTPPVMLDYFEARLKTVDGVEHELIDIETESPGEIVETARLKLESIHANSLLKFLDFALSAIGPIEKWKLGDLIQIDDSLEPYVLPSGCQRRTVAIRQAPDRMYADRNLIRRLSPGQKGVLLLHEAFYYLATEISGHTDSSRVRAFMSVLLRKNTVEADLVAAIRLLEPSGRDSRKSNFSFFYKGLRGVQLGRYAVPSSPRSIQILSIDLTTGTLVLIAPLGTEEREPLKSLSGIELTFRCPIEQSEPSFESDRFMLCEAQLPLGQRLYLAISHDGGSISLQSGKNASGDWYHYLYRMPAKPQRAYIQI